MNQLVGTQKTDTTKEISAADLFESFRQSEHEYDAPVPDAAWQALIQSETYNDLLTQLTQYDCHMVQDYNSETTYVVSKFNSIAFSDPDVRLIETRRINQEELCRPDQ